MSERMTVNNKKKGARKHGFLKRLSTNTGKKVIARRRTKGRKKV